MHKYTPVIDRKIRMAVVGCGRISRNHFGSIEKHSDNLELAAVCDVNEATLREYQLKYGVPGYGDLDQMLQKESLDLVALCTPSGIHPEQTVIAA